ncbi:FMN-binding protein [Clostridium estertheticum]|uniref:FMN-binding protein n=1 Tax=Clostridium estertheticum TaxID=238834 RepID=UPI001C7D0580|nr:FMN-binding protein [Clostridium estertheticum]MBX4271676.1 FMN-binding protein [Clostridium estertheticum]WLC78850.1 FMN-binding protein [Clostridium estertheticum]
MLNLKKIILGAICVVVFTGAIFGVKYLISIQKYKEIIKEIKISSVDLSKVSNGTYTGSCDALAVAATVSVTVKDNKIVKITILKHKNERGKPAEIITGKVIKAQSLQVDTVTGATNSSKVILKSIENALNSGKS